MRVVRSVWIPREMDHELRRLAFTRQITVSELISEFVKAELLK